MAKKTVETLLDQLQNEVQILESDKTPLETAADTYSKALKTAGTLLKTFQKIEDKITVIHSDNTTEQIQRP